MVIDGGILEVEGFVVFVEEVLLLLWVSYHSFTALIILALGVFDELGNFLLLLFVSLLGTSVLLAKVLGVLGIQDEVVAVLDFVGGI